MEVSSPVHAQAHVTIVGAGHAGGSLAAMLRQLGHAGAITLIGEERITPYQRPPLSKAFLKNQVHVESLKLKPDEFYRQKDIALRLGTRVSAIDPAAKRVIFEGEGEAAYDILV